MIDDKEVRYKQKRKNNQELFYITYLPLIQMKNATMISDDDEETFTHSGRFKKSVSLLSSLPSFLFTVLCKHSCFLPRWFPTDKLAFINSCIAFCTIALPCFLAHRRDNVCAHVCVYISRLDSTRLFPSLARSLALVFLRVAERKRLGAKAQCVPKATRTPKGQRVQIIIRYKGGGALGLERGVPKAF